mgnify:CR=1 FL=1
MYLLSLRGYKAFKISTIVDVNELTGDVIGYKAFKISTIVDKCGSNAVYMAIKPLKFLLL